MFHIVSPGRNTTKFVVQHLMTTLQQYIAEPYRVTWIDDASTDDSVERAMSTYHQVNALLSASQSPLAGQADFRILANFKRRYGTANLADAVRAMDPEDVVVLCSGDDFLSVHALERVKREYDAGAWLTYGQYKTSEGSIGHCRPYAPGADFRKEPFLASHLITFKAWLFHCIEDDDLRDEDGEYYKTCGDMAMMLPMLELCEQGQHAHFVPDVLLKYNLHDQCDHVADRANQVRVDKRVRARRPYTDMFNDPVFTRIPLIDKEST